MKTARWSSGSKSWRSAIRLRRSVDDRLALVEPGVADRHHDHAEPVRAVERALGGRDREVDRLLLALAALVGEDADDLERDAVDLDVLADRPGVP